MSTHSPINLMQRYNGSLLGLATGDALGTTLEFKPPGSFKPIKDMVGGGPFQLRPGEWTDDTSMALCLAESLVECKGFDPIDQLKRYVRWYREGHMSCKDHCFDIGNTTRSALIRFEREQQPWCGSTDPQTAGNGSIMRLAPVPLFFASTPEEAIEKSGESSRTTHGAIEAVDACRYLGALLVGAVRGVSKKELLSDHYSPVPGYWEKHPLCPAIDRIASGSFKRRNPPEIRGTGYVVESLEAALWAFLHGTSFRTGCLLAVNLGDDADTTGAVYGQLAGAYYGEEGIPEKWRGKLAWSDTIGSLASSLSAVITKIVSGGQTGADRAALDFAIEHNIPHGGWCPKGRKAEDGPIDARYHLTETPSDDYEQRTEWNVRDSDGTVIFTMTPELSGGSKKTAEFAKKHGKPCLHFYPKPFPRNIWENRELFEFIHENKIKILNVAGSQASEEPEVGKAVKEMLDWTEDLLDPNDKHRGICLRFRDATFCGVTGKLTDTAIAEADAYQAECRVLSVLKGAGYEAKYVLDKGRKPVALEITIPPRKDMWCYPEKIEHLVVRPAQEPDGRLILTAEMKLEDPTPPAWDKKQDDPSQGFVM